MRWRDFALGLTLLLILGSIGSLAFRGLNLGLDFEGGLLVEARASAPVDVGKLRDKLGRLGLGEVVIQSYGGAREVLIRVHQPPEAAEQDRSAAVRAALGSEYDIRRIEFVGPQVSRDLLISGLEASGLAVVLIAAYVWFRFEWQFGISALITTLHDVVAIFGLFSLFGMEFNLTVVAAILTVAGYSINDTIVVFDRVRENLRRYKKMGLVELINLSVNQTLSRTLMTAGTTMLAILSLLVFGGPVLRNFSAALAWGVFIGTYSSIFVASVLLLYMPKIKGMEGQATASGGEGGPAAVKGAVGDP